MSYILNALRKSERERQAMVPDTVADRIFIHQPSRNKSSTLLIAGLIIINLGILVYFLGFSQKAPPPPMQSTTPIVKQELPNSETAWPSPAATGSSAPKTPPVSDIGKTQNPAPLTTLADKTAAVRKQPLKPVKPAIAPPPPTESAKPAAVKVEAAPKKQTEPVKRIIPSPQPAAQTIEAAGDTVEKTARIQTRNDMPFLEDLPVEVSRSLPNLPINVFSYSSIPAERFVMIDMVKYIPGQRIKDQLELKEIREDSIVVGYDNHTFKIRRP